MNPVALYDALNLASTSVLLREGGQDAEADTMLSEARLSAADAFPSGTPEADALGLVLAATEQVPEMAG